jgi:pyruvate dehydrogenase E2 component (dihydrolipoamide acetyltransferase)
VHALFPVIHPPQVAIVGFGVVAVRPWVVAGAVVPRRLVDVSLAADHRVSDGHRGGRFLRRVERVLQKIDPASDGSQ